MFNSMKGMLTAKHIHSFCLETGDIEWVLDCSATTLAHLPQLGTSIKVYCHMHHKEDSLNLFGFHSLKERELFLNLISVSGVGPKGALKILSGVTEDQLMHYLELEDVKSLSKIPGLGTKTAQKILLQLRGKLIRTDEKGNEKEESSELAQALVAMGFDRKKSHHIISTLEGSQEMKSLPADQRDQEILRKAIVELST